MQSGKHMWNMYSHLDRMQVQKKKKKKKKKAATASPDMTAQNTLQHRKLHKSKRTLI